MNNRDFRLQLASQPTAIGDAVNATILFGVWLIWILSWWL